MNVIDNLKGETTPRPLMWGVIGFLAFVAISMGLMHSHGIPGGTAPAALGTFISGFFALAIISWILKKKNNAKLPAQFAFFGCGALMIVSALFFNLKLDEGLRDISPRLVKDIFFLAALVGFGIASFRWYYLVTKGSISAPAAEESTRITDILLKNLNRDEKGDIFPATAVVNALQQNYSEVAVTRFMIRDLSLGGALHLSVFWDDLQIEYLKKGKTWEVLKTTEP